MANIAKWMLDLISNPKTAKFVETLKHSDLPKNWANDPEVIGLAERAYQQGGTESPFFKAWFGDSKVVDDAGKPMQVYHGTNNVFDAFDDKMIGSNTGNYGHIGKGHYTTDYIEEAKTYGKNVMPLYMKALNPENLNIPANREKYLGEFLDMKPETLGVSDEWIAKSVENKYPAAKDLVKAIYDDADYEVYDSALQKALKGGIDHDTIDALDSFVRYNSKELNKNRYINDTDLSLLLQGKDLFGEPSKLAKGYRSIPSAYFLTDLGKAGKEFADAVKKNGYDSVFGSGTERVAFEPTQLKSVNNRGTFNPDDSNIYRSLAPVGIGLGTLASAGFLPDTEASAKSAYINSPEMKAAMMGIRDEPVKEAWNPVEALATAPIGAFTTGARAASVGIDALLSALLGD